MKRTSNTPEPEWSFEIDADRVDAALPSHYSITASPAQCAALARRYGVTTVSDLHAEIDVQRIKGFAIDVTGRLSARIVQPCATTLEPVEQVIEAEEFTACFADPAKTPSFAKAKSDRDHGQGGEFPMLDEAEDPEPIVDGRIDLGEVAAQFLSLAIDPYPRAPGVEQAPPQEVEAGPAPEHPFAALKNWRK